MASGLASKFAPVNRLYQRLTSVDLGSSGLISMIGKPVMTRAFFPGGNGLFLGEDASEFPVGGNLVLGSNFGAYEKFCDDHGNLLGRADETRCPGTWAGLKARFPPSQLEKTFFTNAWPFLHSSPGTDGKRSSNLGTPQKWLKNPTLMVWCAEFFADTLREVKPTLIVALGIAPAAFLGHIFPDALATWQRCKLLALDDLPTAMVATKEGPAVCVAITHPSQSTANARLRREPYRGETGEQRLLGEAFERVYLLRRSR